VFVVSVEFLADHTTVVETASNTHVVRHFYSAAMRADGASSQGRFPVSAAMSLIGMAYSFLGNWHWV
jgi:hypothetical protein